jgi:starvation-inducible outer membrane lipoprotein
LKKLVISFLVMVLALSLSGCMKAKYHITVNKDGSAKEVIEMGMQKELVGMSEKNLFEEIKSDLKEKGYEH